MILTVLIGIRSADDWRTSTSGSRDRKRIGQTLSLRPAVGRAAERAGRDHPADRSGHSQGGRARAGDDETVEVDSELNKKGK